MKLSTQGILAAKILFISIAGFIAYFLSVMLGAYSVAVINISVALLVAGVFVFRVNMDFSGHGVDGSRHVFKMPEYLFGIYTAILTFLCGFAMVGFVVDAALDETVANVKTFPLSAILSWGVSVLDWYVVSSEMTHYKSEYRYRLNLFANGLTADEIDGKAREAREKGDFGPK